MSDFPELPVENPQPEEPTHPVAEQTLSFLQEAGISQEEGITFISGSAGEGFVPTSEPITVMEGFVRLGWRSVGALVIRLNGMQITENDLVQPNSTVYVSGNQKGG